MALPAAMHTLVRDASRLMYGGLECSGIRPYPGTILLRESDIRETGG